MRSETYPSPAALMDAPAETAVTDDVELFDDVSISSVDRRTALADAAKPFLDRVGGSAWFLVDIAVAMIAVWTAYWLSPFSSEAYVAIGHLDPLRCGAVFAVLVGLFARICGLQDPLQNRHEWNVLMRTALVVGLAILGLATIAMWVYYLKVGRYILGLTAIASGFGIYTSRILYWRLATDHCKKVCFIGPREFCGAVRSLIGSQSKRVDTITVRLGEMASSSDDLVSIAQNGSETSFILKRFSADSPDASPVELREWARHNQIDEFVMHGHAPACLQAKLLACLDDGIEVTGYPEYVERNYSRVPVMEIDHEWFLSTEIEGLHPYYRVVKRISDVLIAAVGLTLSAPILAVVALLIWMEDRGPIFYRQVRVGERNRRFEILKLRSMRIDAESTGAQWAKEKDCRATRIGKILRKTRIDEIPQFLNILKGDMAFIGPRPERPEFVEMLAKQIPFYSQRHLLKPGLTGWAQISHTYGASVADALEKLKYDLYYVKHANLELDLHIVIRTIGAVMKGSR